MFSKFYGDWKDLRLVKKYLYIKALKREVEVWVEEGARSRLKTETKMHKGRRLSSEQQDLFYRDIAPEGH